MAKMLPGKFTVSGYIKDAQNGEAMIGAAVIIKELVMWALRPIPMVFIPLAWSPVLTLLNIHFWDTPGNQSKWC